MHMLTHVGTHTCTRTAISTCSSVHSIKGLIPNPAFGFQIPTDNTALGPQAPAALSTSFLTLSESLASTLNGFTSSVLLLLLEGRESFTLFARVWREGRERAATATGCPALAKV